MKLAHLFMPVVAESPDFFAWSRLSRCDLRPVTDLAAAEAWLEHLHPQPHKSR